MTTVVLSKSDAYRLATILGKQPVDSGLAEFHEMIQKQLEPAKSKKDKKDKKDKKEAVASKTKSTKLPIKLTPTQVARKYLGINPDATREALRIFLISKGISTSVAGITVKRLIKD